MHLLIVDDQKAITDSLKNGIAWEGIGIDHVYTAYSAKEAKLILMNLEIDILLTDIEMPEEDGLALVEWVRGHYNHVVCVFLTSHAEFSYAQKAINLQSFDYILQPARFEEVERVIQLASEKIVANKKIKKLRDQEDLMLRQRNVIMDSMMAKLVQNKDRDVEAVYRSFPQIFQLEFERCIFFPLMLRVVRWRKESHSWNENLISLVLQNVLEELLEECRGKTCIAYQQGYGYAVLAVADADKFTRESWQHVLEDFYQFVNRHMDFTLAVYPEGHVEGEVSPVFRKLLGICSDLQSDTREGVLWNVGMPADGKEMKDADMVKAAIEYIRDHIGKNVSRSEVASYVFLNEEYFSRLFRQQTGHTFKNYVLMEKMNAAKNMLEQTGLSVGIIASKVGFDNFSHFSKMFKKFTNMSPQEFRKEQQDRTE